MDTLGDRCKAMEMAEAGRKAMPGLPLLARLDGRAFHTFTQGLKRPFDERFKQCMGDTAARLLEDLDARVAYTQSDEITLAWYFPPGSTSAFPFDGRWQKLASVLAGVASARFTQLVAKHLPDKARFAPCFDCRVWQVPALQDALDVFVWREDDAVKNSITMAAQAFYSHREMHGKNSAEKQEMLFQKGVNWNNYPAEFKRGTYLQRRTENRTLTEEEWQAVPEKHRPPRGELFTRGCIVDLDLPPIRRIANAVEVLFADAEPELRPTQQKETTP